MRHSTVKHRTALCPGLDRSTSALRTVAQLLLSVWLCLLGMVTSTVAEEIIFAGQEVQTESIAPITTVAFQGPAIQYGPTVPQPTDPGLTPVPDYQQYPVQPYPVQPSYPGQAYPSQAYPGQPYPVQPHYPQGIDYDFGYEDQRFIPTEGYTYGLYRYAPEYPATAPAWFPYPWLWPLTNYQVSWLPGDGDQLGVLDFEKHFYFDQSGTSAIQIIPGFATRYFTGPNRVDLAPVVGDLYAEITTQLELDSGVRLDLGIRPGLYGEFFDYVNYDTFRLSGHAVGIYDLDSSTQLVLGGTYLAREDIQALPVAGIVWTPSDDLVCELVFPRPRIAFQFQSCHDLERWAYWGMELGGGSWAVLRDQTRDVATYRDVRMTFGVETHLANGMSGQFEIGWAFSRRLAFASGADIYHPNDAPLLRASLSY